MFYSSLVFGALFTEINAVEKDVIYVSRWIAPKGMLYVEISHSDRDQEIPKEALFQTFVETKFATRVHHTFASDYKITAAISEYLLSKPIQGDLGMPAAIFPEGAHGVGCIVFPSVQALGKGMNFTLKPEYAAQVLAFDGVEKIAVTSQRDQEYTINRIDHATLGEDGKSLKWQGKNLQWKIHEGSIVKVVNEGGHWVVRALDNSIESLSNSQI